jgi:hypothetical protein
LNDPAPTDLLTSPIERTALNRLFVIGGPLGLAVGIVLSLWVNAQRVTHSVVVQAEPQWVAAAPLSVRVQVMAEPGAEVGEVTATLRAEQGGTEVALGTLTPVGKGMAQGTLSLPALAEGPATLRATIAAAGAPPFEESMPVAVVAARAPSPGQAVISTSMSQYADDSEPQPGDRRIVVRARGRILSGFDNEFFVRVTSDTGQPWRGPITVDLVDGEFDAKVGRPDAPARVFEGETDRAGLATMHGPLASEVVRFEVALRDPLAADRILAQRRLRLVSFAGAVSAQADPPTVAPGEVTAVTAGGLSAKRPVFVDIFGPDGAWVGTFEPPISGREKPREIVLPDVGRGIYQLEAYHFTNQPGESTAVVAVLSEPGPSLQPMVERCKQDLTAARLEKEFDPQLERAWLDRLDSLALDAEEDARLRRFLLGTLPPRVHGPPTLLSTRDRDRTAMADSKRRWTIGLRIYMLGGGGLFLLAMTWVMVRSHGAGAATTLRELAEFNEGADQESLATHVRRAQRAALLRGLGVVAVMAGGIILTVVLLENLLWEV